MSQTFLDENPPMILDATCSFARIWPRHATVRIDIRAEVKPDYVMDAGDLKFPNSFFDAIYCDPPHMIRSDGDKFDVGSKWQERMRRARALTGRTSPGDFNRYGFFKSKALWLDFIKRTNAEFYRCLKPSGLLHYKICEGKGNRMVKLTDLLSGMNNFEVIKDRITESKSRFSTGNNVHWLTMKPKSDEVRKRET